MCPNCGHRTFTVEQAKEYARRERTHKALSKKRKVIRIGNALGLTLPKVLQEWGLKEGTPVSFVMENKTIRLVVG